MEQEAESSIWSAPLQFDFHGHLPPTWGVEEIIDQSLGNLFGPLCDREEIPPGKPEPAALEMIVGIVS